MPRSLRRRGIGWLDEIGRKSFFKGEIDVKIKKDGAIKLLNSIVDNANRIFDVGRESTEFIKWNKSVENALERIFDDYNNRLLELHGISYSPGRVLNMWDGDDMHSVIEAYNQGLKKTIAILESYIEEIENYWEEEGPSDVFNSDKPIITPSKIFISHSTKDKKFVEKIIDLLEGIGLNQKQIFCSSFEPYGIPLGEDFLDYLKKVLNENIVVIFMLSTNFYESPICLCEMGATWVKTNTHIPILIPPFDFENIKGVIKPTQGLKITDKDKLNTLCEKLEKLFNLGPIEFSIWDRKRDKFLEDVRNLLSDS